MIHSQLLVAPVPSVSHSTQVVTVLLLCVQAQLVRHKWLHIRLSVNTSIPAWPIASEAATAIGMHGLLSSQSCYHSVQSQISSSLHFVRNLFLIFFNM